ncbi:MAG: L-threonylcarbamoyladenylate synthase [bacterium]|nr:L-threonylcarbamoyladenylate synthase [bacterium]
MEIKELSPGLEDQLAQDMARELKAGKVIVSPTDTVYGLLALASCSECVQRVFEIKGRDSAKPLPLFVENLEAAKEIAEISPEQEAFLSRVWPGKVTCVLKSAKEMPKGVSSEGSVALRVPNNPFLVSFLGYLGEPMTATSANLAGGAEISDSSELQTIFEGRIRQPDILISAGILEPSLPSTIVNMRKTPYQVIRQGAVLIP